MLEKITCIRCGKRSPWTRMRGRKPLRCPDCAREAQLEGWRKANRLRSAELRRKRAFGPETPEVARLVDELAGKLAAMDEATRLDTAWQALRRFGFSEEQMSALLELTETS